MDSKKVVLITGGSSGIGEATATEFAREGYQVVITGRNRDKLTQVVDKLVEISPLKSRDNFLAIQADFEIQKQVEPIVGQAISTFGHLNVVVNNAGYAGKSYPLEHPEFYKDFKNIMQVNLMAATRISQLASPHIIETKGVIINISSIADRCSLPLNSYCISKAGLSMLTKCLANVFEGTGARAITISPGPILSNFQVPIAVDLESYSENNAFSKVGKPIDVANVILFLSSEKAAFINGTTIDVDGGCLNRMAASSFKRSAGDPVKIEVD